MFTEDVFAALQYVLHFKHIYPFGISSVFTPRHDGLVKKRELYWWPQTT